MIVLRPKLCRDGAGYRARVDSDPGPPNAIVGLIGPGRLPTLGLALEWLRGKLALHLRGDTVIDVNGVRLTDVDQALELVAQDVPLCRSAGDDDDSEA